MAVKGDQFVAFRGNSVQTIERQFSEFLQQKPRNIKHMNRGFIGGSRDIGYPKPTNISQEMIDAGMPRPNMPGQGDQFYIDIIYRDEE